MSQPLSVIPASAIDREQIVFFCRKWRIRELSLFGSVLRPSEFGPDSDVDILLDIDPDAPWSLLDLVEMQSELSAIIGRKVDIVERDAIRNPFRRHAILNNRQVIYAA